MPTLNIGGRRVTVGEEFLRLSPDEQNAAVDEIARSLPKAEASKTDAAPDDHGRARRAAMSVPEKIASPITEYPAVYAEMNRESRDQMSRGVGQLREALSEAKPLYEEGGAASLWKGARGAANVGLGALGYLTSPINAAFRTQIGNPVEDLTGVPREYTEFAAQLATPGVGFGRMPSAPGAPVNPANFRPASAPAPAQAAPNELAAASERLTALGSPVEVPRAIASDNIAAQRAGQAIRNIPFVGDAIPKATVRLGEQLEGATGNVAADFGGGSGPNVAHSIGQRLGSAAEQEAIAARAAAQDSDNAVIAAWENTYRNANEAIAAQEGQTLAQARRAVGDMSPQDMGEMLVARLRAGEQEARANKERLYSVAGQTDGSVNAEAVGQVRSRVAQALDDEGRVIDGTLTPASARMMDELQRFSGLNIENRAVGARAPSQGGETIAAVNMSGIEQTRKRLNSMAQSATNDADRSAARRIIREYDNWLGDAFDNALFSGTEEALNAFRAARQANTEWRQRYGFNARDDADRVVNRIVTGEVTPQEVANYVVGATKVGSKGVSSRLLTRIAEATGGDAEAMGAIRGGIWNRLSQGTEGATAKSAEKIASDIHEFLNGSGRDVARRLFTEPEQSIMRTYAQTLREGIEARATVSEMAANTRPSPTEVGIGPFQKLANDVLGKNGRSDEALYSAINAYAKSGARGDINLLSRILQAIPQSERGNLAAAMIRDMGVSPRTGQFSPDVFVSTWGTYRPEAKSMLFGMSGPQRLALDDIAAISRRMKEVGSRFGNPSGTAQNVNFFALASGFMAAPLTTLAGALGGAVTAKVLSSPIGASSAAKWAKSYELMATRKTPASIAAYARASSLLALNISRDTGLPMREIIQRLQGPVAAGAQNEQVKPVREGQQQPYGR